MGTTLSIIAVVVLGVLIIVSMKRRRDMQAAQKQAEAREDTGEADAQYERSQRRRAEVRAAHAERAQTGASDADE
jgi:hypothetical protein